MFVNRTRGVGVVNPKLRLKPRYLPSVVRPQVVRLCLGSRTETLDDIMMLVCFCSASLHYVEIAKEHRPTTRTIHGNERGGDLLSKLKTQSTGILKTVGLGCWTCG